MIATKGRLNTLQHLEFAIGLFNFPLFSTSLPFDSVVSIIIK